MGNNMMSEGITERVKMFARVQATKLSIQQTILNSQIVPPLTTNKPKHYNTQKNLHLKNHNKRRKTRINQPLKRGQTVRYVACKNC